MKMLLDAAPPKRSGVAGQNRWVMAKSRANKLYNTSIEVAVDAFDSGLKNAVLLAKWKPSIFMSGLLPGRDTHWADVASRLRNRKVANIDVAEFSFLDNPNGTMAVLKAIAAAEASCLTGKINFDDEDCLDIGPWLVLATIRPEMAQIFSGGRIGDHLSTVIKSLDLEVPLRFDLGSIRVDNSEIWAFPFRSRRPAGTSKSATPLLDVQSIEKVAEQLCDALDGWLGSTNWELTTNGRGLVMKIVGETLDNAQRFSRPEFPNDGSWSVSGYAIKTTNGTKPTIKCQLAFLSVGSSVAQTVVGCNDDTRIAMENYVDRHIAALPNHTHAANHLRTIYALQDLVSGDADAIKNGRGGTGFRDIISLFGDLASATNDVAAPRLAIVSGRTCLHIDRALSDAVRKPPNERFNIWFNEENANDFPPDRTFVIELAEEFRGTLVTMVFELDQDYLKK